jgi:hypothetical protein
MFSWQKYIIHPLTALLFAVGTAKFIEHYQILEFPYAWLISFILVAVGYLFLSRKYDPSLSIVFFLASGFVGYQAMNLHMLKPQALSSEQLTLRKLYVLNAWVQRHQTMQGELPLSLKKATTKLESAEEYEVDFCLLDDCKKVLPDATHQDYYVMVRPKDDGSAWMLMGPDYQPYSMNTGGQVTKVDASQYDWQKLRQ